jgi:uncharacterized damage-inducible protein DinB
MAQQHELVDQYEAGAEKVSLAIRNLTPEDLLSIPDPAANVGKWSIQQVVIHLADAEAAFADRFRRMIAEDNPILYAWDENLFAARLSYEQQSAHDAVELIRLMRVQTTRILRAAGEGALSRRGNHSERGPVTLAEGLAHANRHLDHHIKFIHDKRAYMGKEMW